MSKVLKILNQIEQAKGKEKLEILMSQKSNEYLKEVCRLTYSPTVQFYIKKIPDGWQHSEVAEPNWNTIFQKLEKLSSREITGHKAVDYLINGILSCCDHEISEVVHRVVKKDLKCGIGASTINKVWKNLIVKPPRQGACSMNEKSLKKMESIKNLTVELKSDGSYAASVCGEETTMMSRNGNPLEIPSLQEHLSSGAFNGFALEGELIYDPTKATREEGNGHITRIVKGTASEEHLNNVYYQVWDCIDTTYYEPKGEYPFTNRERRELLEIMVAEYNGWCVENGVKNRILLIPRKENVTVEDAFTIFEDYVRDGFEGAIAKDMDSTWKDNGKPSYCIKLKRKEPCDLKVTGIYEAEKGSKYEGMLGGLHCESSCGRIKVDVGSGFNDEERKEFFSNPPKIIEVEYDSITKDKRTKQESLFLPIYKNARYDKLESDSYQDILDKQRIK